MGVTIVMGNHYISVIWKILKILNILMRTLYLMLSVSLDSGENSSNEKVNESVVELGRCGSNLTHGHNLSHFRLSCACLVCCLRKSTQFHDMWMECQIIIIHFLLLISHQSPACAKRCHIPYLLLLPNCYCSVTKVMVYINNSQ